MLLNKKTAMSFDQVMQEITALVNLNSGIVKKLLTLNRREVLRLADFFGEENVFIAYGNENKVNEEDFNLVDDEAKRLFHSGRKPMRGQMRLPVRNESINRRRESLSSINNRQDRELLKCLIIVLTCFFSANTTITSRWYVRTRQSYW